jgi:hypothetical protein
MDVEAMRGAYLRAIGDGATHSTVLIGLEAAKARLVHLVEAGECLVQALAKNANLSDPEVAAALKNWEALR